MNRLGIIGAMEEEVKILKEKMQVSQTRKLASMEFFEGFLSKRPVVVVRSGIGKVNAAICTQILIDQFRVDGIVNTGVAGSLKNEIDIGDIVLSSDTLQHDMDATGFGYSLGIIPRMEQSIFPADQHMIDLALRINENVNREIHTFVGRVISGDQFISDLKKKEFLAEEFKGYCTEMEGAAIGQTAWLNHVPFLIIRAISDKADHSAEQNYSEFEAKAIEHSVKLVSKLAEELLII